MNNNVILKNVLKTIIIIFIIIPIIIVILDYANISLINMTRNYDWLAFIGAYMGSIATLALGYVSIKQNETLGNINKKISENNIISMSYSKIDFAEKQFIDITEGNTYGFKLKSTEEKSDKPFRLILKIIDLENKPLKDFSVKNITIQYNKVKQYEYKDKIEIDNSIQNTNEILEKDVDIDKNSYYLPIICYMPEQKMQEISKCGELRITTYISIRNCFNIVSDSENTIILSNSKTVVSDIWYECRRVGRKIYYKDIFFDNK